MSVRRLADPALQPPTFAFNAANAAWAERIIRNYPEGRQQSAVILLLMRAQEQEGWVTKAAIEHVAQMLGMAYIRALEVATFYTQYQLKPVGARAHVQVCGTTPCMLRGAEALMDICRERIHPEQFHLNAAGTLSWEEVECLGACVNAPMVMIFKDTYEDLTPQRLGEIIDAFEAGRADAIPPGPQVDRLTSAPPSGLTSLTDEAALLKAVRERQARPAEPAAAPAPAEVAPSRAAKPQTFAPETNPALITPSPEKTPVETEKAASAPAPQENPQQANKAAEEVEKTLKQRKSKAKQPLPSTAAMKSPELLRGEPLGPDGKRAPEEAPAAPVGAPMPESPDTGGARNLRGPSAPKAPGENGKD
jgi:NADH-quinone oxidoreductase subunit E